MSLCVFTATTFWFLNALNGKYSTTIYYPINFVFDTDKYIELKKLPKEIQININGLGWSIFKSSLGLNKSVITYNLQEPTNIKKISSSMMLSYVSDQVKEFKINFVYTDTVFVDIDHKISIKLPIEIDSSSILLDKGYWITSTINSEIDSVTLTGPKSYLDKIQNKIIIKIPQEDLDENFDESVTITTQENELIQTTPNKTRVSFKVEEFVEDSIKVVAKPVNFPVDSSAYLLSSEVNIFYKIGIDNVKSFSREYLDVVADFNNLIPSDSTVPIRLNNIPTWIKVSKIDSTFLKVVYSEK